jgi:hypothetical protein
MHRNGSKYGLEFLKGETFKNDPGHVQLSGEFSGPAMIDKATVYGRLVERFKDNLPAQRAAIERMKQIFAVERDEQVQGQALFNRRVQDTTMESLATGGVQQQVTEDDFAQHRKAGESVEDARDRYQSYQADLRNGTDRHAMEDMSSPDMRAMVEAVRPAPDSPGGMTQGVQRQAFLAKSMEEIDKQRRTIPQAPCENRQPSRKR